MKINNKVFIIVIQELMEYQPWHNLKIKGKYIFTKNYK